MTNLFTSFYKTDSKKRNEELEYVLKKNVDNFLIDRIYLAAHTAIPIQSQKIIPIYVAAPKMTFDWYFKWINRVTKGQDLNILSNSDIYFIDIPGVEKDACYALSRYEVNEDYSLNLNQVQIHGDSQDCWIFKGKILPVKADFFMGMMGCDNRLAHELQQAGYTVTNPSKRIKTWHVHSSNVRGYDINVRNENTVVPPPYLTIKPSF